MNFNSFQLKELASIQTGPFGSQLHKEDYCEIGTPIVTVEHLGQKNFRTQNLPKISDHDTERLKKYLLKTGDIVFSRVGSVDRCSYVSAAFDKWLFSGRCLRVRVANETLNPEYLYYYFCQNSIKEYVRSVAVGATMPSINTKIMGELPIKLPNRKNQDQIVNILSSFDDKIEVNNKIIKNLEKIIQNSYILMFENNPSYPMGKLGDILSLRQQKILAEDVGDLPYLPIDSIPCKSFAVETFRPSEDAKSSLIKFKRDDILIGAMRVYFHRVIPAPIDGVTRSTCMVLTPKEKDYFSYCLISCNQKSCIDYAQSISKGSTMPYAFWEKGLSEYNIKIPDRDTANTFQNFILPMIRKIQSLANENVSLNEIKSLLLPKLLSGEIELKH